MGRIVHVSLLAALLSCAWSTACLSEKRVALVIGNGGYLHGGTLPNPVRDAEAVAQLFRKANFDPVQARRDLGNDEFRRALREFSLAVSGADIAVVFFAGHGIEINGINYLLPIDARLRREFDVADEAVSLDRVLEAIEPAARLRLVILDACRENPFVRTVQRSSPTRSITRGLGKVEPTMSDTLIAYAAKAGSYSDDGDGVNSPFTTALLKYLLEPGMDIRLAFGRVRDEVLSITRRQQEPFLYGSLGGSSVSLAPAPPILRSDPSVPEDVRVDYELAERINTKASWGFFLEKYKTGYYADLAREHLRLLLANSEHPKAYGTPAVPGPKVPPTTKDRARKPGDVFRDCEACPEIVVVPDGVFQMGSQDNNANANEKPVHTVAISKFGMGKMEVTVRQFVAFLNSSVRENRSSDAWITGDSADNASPVLRTGEGAGVTFAVKPLRAEEPITFVSWHGADAYVNWLSKQTGFGYRLPSEAEWEYAARAGSAARYPFGDDHLRLCNYANVADITGQKTHRWNLYVKCDDGYAELAPVGKFQPNAFGLHDMIGNAAEWVADCWHSTYEAAPADGSAWIANGNCNARAVRGGSYATLTAGVRSAQRYVADASAKYKTTGFRVARSLP